MKPSSRRDRPFPALPNAEERRETLRHYRTLGTAGPERDFDRITRLLAQTCHVPTALIALLDGERQWFKSCFGYRSERETTLGLSFAAEAVRRRDTLVVEDATQDPRFAEAPAVTGEPDWRFYAGTPLQAPSGVMIGVLCIVDYTPRVFDAGHRAILEDLADLAISQFERRSVQMRALRHERLVENVQEVVFETDLEGQTTFLNGAWEDTTGFPREEALGESLAHFVHPKDRVESLQAFAPLLQQRQNLLHHRTRFLTKDGTERAVEFRARLVTDEDGTPTGTVGTLTPMAGLPPPRAEESEEAASPDAAAPPGDGSEADGVPSKTLADVPEASEPSASPESDEDSASLDESPPPAEEPPPPEDAPPAASEPTIEPKSEDDAAEEELFAGLSDWSEAPSAKDESRTENEPLTEDAPADAPPSRDEKAPSDLTSETNEPPSNEPPSEETAPAEADTSAAASGAAPGNGASSEEEIDETLSDAIAQGFPELEAVEREADFAGDETLDDVRRRLSTDPPNLRLSSFDYAEHLGALLDELEPAARRKGLVMHRALPDRSVSVEADPGALRLLVAALVGHAVDATDEGSITVSGRARGTGEVHLRVVDTGADISQSLLNSLLDTGTAPPDADDAEAKPEKRHLSFVHRLVNLMRGAVEMESRRGRGTVFTVILPRHPDAEASVRGVAAPAETDDPDGAPSEWIPTAEEPPAEEPLAEEPLAPLAEEPLAETAPADDDTPASPAADEPGNGDDEELLSWERDSIFNTSSEEPEANDDSDAFRTDPDSPFSF
ncbi:MAG: hypothetical protein BRD47_06610 [Bacteroidetes bacterium QS_8_68_28]|nr:MAG: hypothetical protein BRD47_06610 [Bacteroidetes bacterium QS_8_68_28]